MSTSSPYSAYCKSVVVLLFLAGTFFAFPSLHAQTAAPAAKAPSSSPASGFSIETEMLTYRALQTNGEAIACDVAAYLYGTKPDFKSVPSGAICNVGASGGPSSIGIVVLPFDRNVFSDFQIWRSDMQTMAEFEARGANACSAAAAAPPPPEPNRPAGVSGRGLTTSATTATAAVGGVMGALTPAGAMLSTGQGILGLFAKTQAAEPVGGTIEDQAFMDNVSRELRAVNLSVLMPDVYTPYALTSVDPARSPFVVALDKLLHLRDCLANSKSPEDPDIKNIDDFLGSLAGGPTAAVATPRPSGGVTTTTTTTTAPAQPANTTPSRLESALNADGLAQQLGADPQTGKIPATAPQHLLMVKALESGGSVNHNSNIFGTKMSYSGGSVGTYALFNLSGRLECSGNVYDYAGPVNSADFQKNLNTYKPNPGDEVIFQRGACAPLR
ncbi:MAG: hypothetical protein ABSG84_18280 [Acidobacteriaceae bacterium]|jgi:hypothetical protein